jgi:hypothetical protein
VVFRRLAGFGDGLTLGAAEAARADGGLTAVGSTEEAEQLALQALASCQAASDQRGAADSLAILVALARTRGDTPAARQYAEEPLAAARDAG